MKKTAVLLYDSFCNFEISPALEILALAEKPITIFGISKQAIRSEDGLSVIPDATIDNFDLDAYDSLILPGAMDIREAIENKHPDAEHAAGKNCTLCTFVVRLFQDHVGQQAANETSYHSKIAVAEEHHD